MTNTDPADVKNRHVHGLTATDAQLLSLDARIKALSAAIEAHDARLDDLEGEVVVVPPDPPPAGEPAFLSRPASGPIVIDGGTVRIVSNVSIRGGTVNAPSGIGITIRNVNGTITIRDVDLSDLVGGIFIQNCSGVLLVENVRSRNIGDGTIGSGHSNHIQIAESSFTGAIRKNRFLGGRTEDMLSIWHSGGKGVGQELIVEDNHLEGRRTDSATVRAWTRTSGTGIIISDGAGSSKNGNLIVRRNTLLTPGQVCIQIIDGPNLQILDNVILAEPYALNNNPMTTWEGQPKGVASGNRYYMTKGDGSHPDPWQYASTGMSFTGNIEDPNLKASDLAVVL